MKAIVPSRQRLNLRTKPLINHPIAIHDLKFNKDLRQSNSAAVELRKGMSPSTFVPQSRSISKNQKTDTKLGPRQLPFLSRKANMYDPHESKPLPDSARNSTFNRTNTSKSHGGNSSVMAQTGGSNFTALFAAKGARDDMKETSSTLLTKTRQNSGIKWKSKKPSDLNFTAHSKLMTRRLDSKSSNRSKLNSSTASRASKRPENYVRPAEIAKKVFTPEEMKRLGYLSDPRTRSQFVKNCHGKG